MKPIFKIILGIGAFCAISSVFAFLLNRPQLAEPLFISSLVAVAMGIRGVTALRGFAYPVMIFGVVSTALLFPKYFVEIGGFKLSLLITPLIQIIMFGMGTTMSFADFLGVVRAPKGVFIGVTSQFVIMPMLGFTLASLTNLPPEIAAGIVLIGCVPGGVASNVISYLAKANVALSITITSVSTLLAPFITPFLMRFLAGSFMEINVLEMMWDIIKMVILPIGLALIFNHFFSKRMKWAEKLMPFVSMFGIAFIIMIGTALGRDSLLQVGPVLLLVMLVHNLTGYMIGYWSGRLFRMNEKDCRTIAIEVGMQNAGLAKGLANELGRLGTLGLAPMVFGPLMNISGSILASRWHKSSPLDEQIEEETSQIKIVPIGKTN